MKFSNNSLRIKGFLIVLSVVFLAVNLIVFQDVASAEDDDDAEEKQEDLIKNIGLSALILFTMGFPYIILFQIVKLFMKLPKENERAQSAKKAYLKFFKLVRKPLLYIHYAAGFSALVLLLYHGINFTFKDAERGIVGWTTASLLSFYVISGLLIKLKIKSLTSAKKLKKVLGTIHRSLILIIIAFSLHIVHIVS